MSRDLAHLAVLALALVGAAACASRCVSEHGLRAEANCEDLAALDEATSALLVEDGLSPDALAGVALDVAPDSDGGAFPPLAEERAEGFTEIFGRTRCHAGTVTLANDRWTSAVACHELFHVARGCNGNAADHPWMASRHVDERCAEAVSRSLPNLTGSMGGAL